MIWLIHPSHRKYIKRLRERVGAHGYIVMTRNDFAAMNTLWITTTNSIKRHQGIYRIILNIINRKVEDIDREQISGIIKPETIEKELRLIELKNPLKTIRNTILYHILKHYHY